jgi:hypothetical protein
MFLQRRLDRANHDEAATKIQFCAHSGKLPDGQKFAGRTADWQP